MLRRRDRREPMESCAVNGTIGDANLPFLDEGVEAHDFLLGELADRDKMPGGLDGQGCHYTIPPVIGLGEPGTVVEKRQVVYSHHLVANQDRAQSREAENEVVLLAEEEEWQHALLPEMGVADAVVNNGEFADIVVLVDGCLGTDDGKWLLEAGHRLAHAVGIALDTRHGLCQKSSVDIYCHVSLF